MKSFALRLCVVPILILVIASCGGVKNPKKSKNGGGNGGLTLWADCVCKQKSNGYINAHLFNVPLSGNNLVGKEVTVMIPQLCRSYSACGSGFYEQSGGSIKIKVNKTVSSPGYVYKFAAYGFPVR